MKVIKYLLDHDATIDIKDENGKYLFLKIKESFNKCINSVINYLLNYDIKMTNLLVIDKQTNSNTNYQRINELNFLKILVANGLDINKNR